MKTFFGWSNSKWKLVRHAPTWINILNLLEDRHKLLIFLSRSLPVMISLVWSNKGATFNGTILMSVNSPAIFILLKNFVINIFISKSKWGTLVDSSIAHIHENHQWWLCAVSTIEKNHSTKQTKKKAERKMESRLNKQHIDGWERIKTLMHRNKTLLTVNFIFFGQQILQNGRNLNFDCSCGSKFCHS